ncbi:hypothetical protein RM697_08730 [Ichthyenterobacterium sp. W332]|uniref:O-antigen ligase family protein n=1 Tax=Microcosmobacter mediterraneus TaxID=3075607 RepID=A0ABU2YN86_9FLAO|nr:hypothetical protein [Ichthyenterobacterium sp. W332]MDT0558730.1 hypothetical protein [Ichthyenterobacterium sp. W332]
MKVSYYIWFLYLVLFPFYLFSEGNPQLADALGALLILLNIKTIITSVFDSSFTKFLLFFVLYAVIISAIWMANLDDILILRNSIYYVYSFLIFLFVYGNINNDDFLKMTFYGLLTSALIQCILIPLNLDQGFRAQLFFNNPNQLALWSLCVIIISNSISLLTSKYKKATLALSVIASIFIVLSASRSAVVCVMIFWLFFFVKSRKHFLTSSAILISVFAFFYFSESKVLNQISQFTYITDRLTSNKVSGHSTLDERGYSRIFDYPQHLIFGAAEGSNYRFNTKIELHSTLPNILFSYGIIGFILFGIALSKIAIKPYKDVLILFLIIMIFAYVHMILRLPIFWLTLLFLYTLKVKKENSDLLPN